MSSETDLQNKIMDVFEELPYKKLIDVHNKVLEALDPEKQGYIYKCNDETIDRVFKDWKPSEIIHYLDDRDWFNAEYFAYDDTYGWQTYYDAKEAVEECVDIYNLAVTIKNRYVRCGVPEIDKIITNKLAKAETTEETE